MMNSRRGASALSEPIELLFVDKTTTDPVPTPPHPSTLKDPSLSKPTRSKMRFLRDNEGRKARASGVLLNNIVKPLEGTGVVSDTATSKVNVWHGWMRVPKKQEPWESKKERIEGIRNLDGDFHRVNIT